MNILEARRRTLGKGVYKKTVEGNPAIAQGSLARMYPGITMQGWTEQAQYEGNQLFDASVFDGIERSGVSVSVDNGVITATGASDTAIWIHSANMTEEDFKKFKSGNIYVKNYKTSDCNYEVCIYINNTTVNEGNSPYNIPDGYLETNPHNVCFFIDIRAGIELKGSCKPMIYQDGVVPYEPYTGGAPSPNPDYPQEIVSAGNWNEETQKWEYEIEVGGANLWGLEQSIEFERVIRLALDGELPAGEYTFSAVVHSTDTDDSQCMLILWTADGGQMVYYIGRSDGNSRVSAKISMSKPAAEISLYASTTNVTSQGDTASFDDIMFNIGDTALPYEPYHLPQTVTLTSDRPLTKWDKLEKRNGQWGWVYKSGTISGNDINIIQKYNDEIIEGMLRHSFGTSFSPGYEHRDNIFCNKLVDSKHYDNFDFAYSVLGSGILRIISNDNTGIDTLEEMQTYWASLPDVVFYYETAEETFVPLSESEQEQMNELYTFRPTTVLSNDCDCNMTLTYKTKKSLEVTT